jgi:hypothetical protein
MAYGNSGWENPYAQKPAQGVGQAGGSVGGFTTGAVQNPMFGAMDSMTMRPAVQPPGGFTIGGTNQPGGHAAMTQMFGGSGPGMMAGQSAQGPGSVGAPQNLGYFGTNTNQGGPVDNGPWSTGGMASGPTPDYAAQYAAADASRVATPGFQQRNPLVDSYEAMMRSAMGGVDDWRAEHARRMQPAQSTGAGFGPGGPPVGDASQFTVGRAPGAPAQQAGMMAGQSASGGSVGSPTSTYGSAPAVPGVANNLNSNGLGDANPYLKAQADFLGSQMNDQLQRGLQGIRSNAVGVGGLGGSRQAIAEAEAIKGAQGQYGGALANMLGNTYLQDKSINTGSYNANRGMDLQQAGLGLSAMNMGLQAPFQPSQAANDIYGNYTGLGTQSTGGSGGGWQGALGGLLAGGSFGKQMGWW